MYGICHCMQIIHTIFFHFACLSSLCHHPRSSVSSISFHTIWRILFSSNSNLNHQNNNHPNISFTFHTKFSEIDFNIFTLNSKYFTEPKDTCIWLRIYNISAINCFFLLECNLHIHQHHYSYKYTRFIHCPYLFSVNYYNYIL